MVLNRVYRSFQPTEDPPHSVFLVRRTNEKLINSGNTELFRWGYDRYQEEQMQDAKSMVDNLVTEVRGIIEKRSILGEAVTVGEVTIIPVASYGFGFGGGAGSGTDPASKEQGSGGGAGAGGGIKPVALIVIDKDGARVEQVQTGKASLAETIAATAERIAEKQTDKQKESQNKEPATEE